MSFVFGMVIILLKISYKVFGFDISCTSGNPRTGTSTPESVSVRVFSVCACVVQECMGRPYVAERCEWTEGVNRADDILWESSTSAHEHTSRFTLSMLVPSTTLCHWEFLWYLKCKPTSFYFFLWCASFTFLNVKVKVNTEHTCSMHKEYICNSFKQFYLLWNSLTWNRRRVFYCVL